ncbi:FtsK/SpoIIIE domain-containing protein [Pseudonocardia lacus]|uniref:FtsK/SpoIIIE domain-containing protein n=1 Tax=Pseudonocardia lacus TaxID=2835865 RepID=UPI001BDBE8F0|nr:FtsK/SpoIIIE domain-containing protein [Pseudonocardia lacus]
MAVFGFGRRRRIREAYDALCAAIATALGGAETAAERVRRAHLDAVVELLLREKGVAAARADPALARLLTSSGVADVVARVERDASALAVPAEVPARLSAIVEAAAPGPAGERGAGWLERTRTGDLDGTGELPSLWRVGTGRLGGSPPFDVAVPLLDESHLQVITAAGRREAGIAVVQGVLMRVLSTVAPGTALLHVWDVGQLTGPLPDLHPLTRTGLLTVHDPSGLAPLLEELSDRIRRVHNRVLVDGQPSLRALAQETGKRDEPWVIAVLVGNGQALPDEEDRQLQRIARGGLACGVHLVLVDVPIAMGAPVETITLATNGLVTTSMTGAHAPVEPDAPLEPSAVAAACHRIADEHDVRRARIGTFVDLLPDQPGTQQSLVGLHAPIGFTEGRSRELALIDASPHALIGGPSGSGKTNLLLAMIASMASRYGPDELELYLLDFKEGVSFAQLAPGRQDGSWLPHARLIGININTDREFGLALLRFLSDEMRRRAEAAKEYEVTKLEDLRRELAERAERGELRPGENTRWPRIVAVIDEFQYLFASRDSVTRDAVRLLEDVARRGRSQGIHLVLASQDVSGIEAFWGRPAIFEQFVVRIALPRARRILDERNEAALDLPRWHAVVNHESGMRHGNEIVRVPNASVRGTVDVVQRHLHARYADHPPPRLFDGTRAPLTEDLLADARPDGEPVALVGQCIDVAGSPAVVRLPDVPGRNIGVLGPGLQDAVRLLDCAGAALAATHQYGTAEAVLVPLVVDARKPADGLATRFTDHGHSTRTVPLEEFGQWLREVAADITTRLAGTPGPPVVVVLYAADAADSVLDRAGTEALRTLIHFGPEVGVHVLGWWRSVPRLKALLMMGAAADDIGAWVALDVQGSELQTLVPGMLLTWSPRPGRGLWFDRARHADPEVVIVPIPEVDR